MTPEELMTVMGGAPLVDETFQPKKLLTLAAVLRRELERADAPLLDYAAPERAAALYSRLRREDVLLPGPNGPLSPPEVTAVDGAVAAITAIIPEWEPIFAVPLVYRKLLTAQVSLTNPLLPQHIYLGQRAFATEARLRETLVHEMSHVWNGLVAEIFDFELPCGPVNLVLPSGTGGRRVRGVLFAGLFAAAGVSYYSRANGRRSDAAAIRRGKYLECYLAGCVDTLSAHDFLSRMGQLLVSRLKAYVTALSARRTGA